MHAAETSHPWQISQYDQFLQAATTRDPACDHALGRNRLYGLYTSWCFLSQAAPGPEDAFWTAMTKKRIHPKRAGLRMKGPAGSGLHPGQLPASGLTRMSTTSHTYLPRDPHQPRGRRLWCARCNTDRHLLVESVTTLSAQQETLAAAITCTKCGGSRVMATTAALPGRNQDTGDVVHRDAAYAHCQEPMSPEDPELRGVHWPVSTQARLAEFLSVYLKTRVLRCRCGFQIEILHS